MAQSIGANDSTEIIDKNEIRVGTFETDDKEVYAYRAPEGHWCHITLGGGDHEMPGEVSEYLGNMRDNYVDLSPFAEAMIFAHELAEKTSLTHKQAEIWTVREKLGWSRGQVDTRFNMSSSNVDEHLRVARKKIDQAHRLVEIVE